MCSFYAGDAGNVEDGRKKARRRCTRDEPNNRFSPRCLGNWSLAGNHVSALVLTPNHPRDILGRHLIARYYVDDKSYR